MDEEELTLSLRRYGDISRASQHVSIETLYTGFITIGGRPVIPGSSIKGNVRARLELSFRARNGRVRACFARATPPLRVKPKRGEHGWRHYAVWGNVLNEDRGLPCDLTRNSKVCMLCDLFGAAGLRGLICFGDFVGDNVSLERLDLEHGMKILAAKPGSKFKGKITFMNLKPEELGLLLFGMGITNSRTGRKLLLGRLKYRHKVDDLEFGVITYSVDSLEISHLSERLFDFGPGERISGDELDSLVKRLIEEAKRAYSFGQELQLIDEVGIIEKIR